MEHFHLIALGCPRGLRVAITQPEVSNSTELDCSRVVAQHDLLANNISQ